MSDSLVEALRNAILLESDWHSAHAVRLDQWAKGGTARVILEKQMIGAAIACRARAQMLNTILIASEPQMEAKAT
jgi:hypothetical protein